MPWCVGSATGRSNPETDDLIRELDKQSGKAEAQCDALKTERIPLLKSELDDQAARVELLYPEKWVEATGGIRYQKELALRGQAARIAEAFPREQSKARNAREQTWDQLVEYRRAYNDRYKMGFDIKAERTPSTMMPGLSYGEQAAGVPQPDPGCQSQSLRAVSGGFQPAAKQHQQCPAPDR